MIEEPENTEEAEESDTVVSDAEDTASAPAATPEPPAAEPEVQLTPKERRSQKRAASRGTEARPARTQEERTAARLEKRKANADERRRYRAKSRTKRRTGGEGTPPAERSGTGSPRVLRGTVVSDKADKTITVRIDVARQHRTYGKIVRTSSKLSAHDERNEAAAGDTVRVVESRPLSRSKRWRLVEVVEKAR
jgi:small subunit ribosomal protein S17